MKYTAILAILATAQAHRLHQHHSERHACDYVDEKGEEIPTSLAV